MVPSLPLEEMTIAEKLKALELLWDDLCRRPSEVPSPPWHEQVLKDRERSGSSTYVDLEEAKERIRRETE